MFYDNLKEECDRQELKMTPIVKECGGSTGTISNWKRGASPNSDIVMKLATRLNVTTDYLLFGEQQENEKEIKLISIFRKLTESGKDEIINYAEYTSENPKYKKYTDVPKEA